jgi:hypothetical protein
LYSGRIVAANVVMLHCCDPPVNNPSAGKADGASTAGSADATWSPQIGGGPWLQMLSAHAAGTTDTCAGRVSQRLLEIETY